MGFLTAKRVGIVLLLVWLITLLYLWFPSLIDAKKWPWLVSHLKGRNRLKTTLKNYSSSDVVHVCMSSGKETLGGMVATINSIFTNSKHPVMFHLVTDEESIDHLMIWLEKTRLREVNYELKPFPKEWIKGKISVTGSRPELSSSINFARFFLPRLFPQLKSRIVFLDDDCIVQGDIWELYSMKFKPGTIAAFSEDCTAPSKRITLMKNNYADYIDFKNKHVQKMNMSPTACAFNTGVFVTDLSHWIWHNITEKLEYWMLLNTREEVYGNEKGGGGSQPPMMIVFYKKYTPISPAWHVRFLGWTSGTSYSKQFLAHAKLLHWNGRFKPWGRLSQHSDLWDRYFIPDPTKQFQPVRKLRI